MSLKEGRDARDEGIARVENSNLEWLGAMTHAFMYHTTPGDTFDADKAWELAEFVNDLPVPTDRRVMGALIPRLRRLGFIELIPGERRESTRKVHHAFPMQVWRIVR